MVEQCMLVRWSKEIFRGLVPGISNNNLHLDLPTSGSEFVLVDKVKISIE